MINLNNLYKIFIIVFAVVSLFSYKAGEIIGVESKVVNLLFTFILFFVNLFFLLVNKRFIQPKNVNTFYLICFIFVWCFIVSLIRNSPVEWIPSFFRFFSYILMFINVYLLTQKGFLGINFVTTVCVLMLMITSIFGLFTVMSGNMTFVNGGYRSSGNFESYLGFGLMLFVTINYLLNVELLSSRQSLFSMRGVFMWLLFFFGFWMLQTSQSRMLTFSLIFNFGALFYLDKGIKKKSRLLVLSLVGLYISYWFVMNTEIAPRLQSTFTETSSGGTIDMSTLYRIFIHYETVTHMTWIDYIIGIGMGGFNIFFFKATGELGVAAHDDYLLFLAEGGIITLFLYLVFQFRVIRLIKHYYRANLSNPILKHLGRACIVIFFSIFVVGVLLNAYYFYQVVFFITLMLGVYFGSQSADNKSLIHTK
jgi:hypothetical protein